MTDTMTENEAWYDAEIAPVLMDLGEKLQARGMSLVAVVEYTRGERGSTICIAEDAGLEMRMLHMLSNSAPNVDSFMINLKRYCDRNDISTESSMYLRRFGA